MLKLDEQTAIKLYPAAVPEFKAMMEQTFGKKTFIKDIRDIVKSFEDACEVNGTTPDQVLPPALLPYLAPDEIAYRKLKEITKALNEGIVLSFSNPNQRKWRPWFEQTPSGFRFGASDFVYTFTHAGGGSRLCFAEEKNSDYAGKQFIDLYEILHTK